MSPNSPSDPAASARLWERYRVYLLAIANRELPDYLRAKVAASDLVQEALVRANENIGSLRGTGELIRRAWLVRIFHGVLLNAVRAYRTQRRAASEVPIEDAGLVPTADHTPSEDLGAREAIRNAFKRLPRDLRRVLWACDVKKLPQEEVARRMELSVDQVQRRCAKARLRFQAELGNQA